MRLLLFGYGNDLRGDDGFGPVVAERFSAEAEKRLGTGTAYSLGVITGIQLLPEHADDIADADRVVFVDAAVDIDPGTIREYRVEPDDAEVPPLGHQHGPGGLLAYARALYDARPEAHVVSVGALTFETGEPLSEPVAAAIDEVLERITRLFADP